jgi:tagaturonate reductase
MLLAKQNLAQIGQIPGMAIPPESLFALPERMLQFGTGVFLRGLIDYYIDKANRADLFNGRVVVVKSTSTGDTGSFDNQDGLYTLLMKSAENGVPTEQSVICSSISRVLHAGDEWAAVLKCAEDPQIRLIVSNTTETGIVLLETDRVGAGASVGSQAGLPASPPESFPGKLLAYLLKRYTSFNGSAESGMVVIPTELIPGNGDLLKKIVNELALINRVDPAFIQWLNRHCEFCNSLVDRIVPGRLPQDEHTAAEKELGYDDDLMIMSETYGLWAIETSSERTTEMLSFHKADQGIHVVPNIYTFRELKLRLLNGSHNLSCALGFLSGFKTVKEAMADTDFEQYMHRLILEEIAPAIVDEFISAEAAAAFGKQVLERYRNPYISFDWLNICVQDTAKIRIRAVPIVLKHAAKHSFVPDGIALGFAAYILFMKSDRTAAGEYTGTLNGKVYAIQDDFAGLLYEKWATFSDELLVANVLSDTRLWGTDLSQLDGFVKCVTIHLNGLVEKGFKNSGI